MTSCNILLSFIGIFIFSSVRSEGTDDIDVDDDDIDTDGTVKIMLTKCRRESTFAVCRRPQK